MDSTSQQTKQCSSSNREQRSRNQKCAMTFSMLLLTTLAHIQYRYADELIQLILGSRPKIEGPEQWGGGQPTGSTVSHAIDELNGDSFYGDRHDVRLRESFPLNLSEPQAHPQQQ
jgi:hypothetical protein